MLSPEHIKKVLARGFNEKQIKQFASANDYSPILESLTPKQIQADWLDRFPTMRGNDGGALLLRFNGNTVSLKPDKPDWDEERQRFHKYLYTRSQQTATPGRNTQPWIPSNPPRIATEGLFDALACTAIIGIPCAAVTAPSHIRNSKFPSSTKVYISDADVPFHHAPSLLPVVVEQCREKGLLLAHLPRNPKADYTYIGSRIPEDCKWGMEEWTRYWIQEDLKPQVELQKVIDNAQPPFNYLREIFLDYQKLGIGYPDHQPIIENACKAIATATKKPHKRRLLRDLLHKYTLAPITWIDQVITSKDPAYKPSDKEPSEWDLRIQQAEDSGHGDPVAIHDARMALLEERCREIIISSRPIRDQKDAIKSVAQSIGFKPDNNFVSSLYQQLDNDISIWEPDIEPGGTFTAQDQSWLLFEVFIIGLNLFVGMPGAGKSRLLVALICAHLSNQSTFIGRDLQPGGKRNILLIGTDQDRQQWGALLAEQGLAIEVNREQLPEGPDLVSYRLHPNIHLKTLGGGFRLDADGMRYIRTWCRENPNGLLIIDSLSAVLPADIKETDESAGRLMRQVDAARLGNCCIVTHHSTKNAAHDGELGVYSGSGSGSIDRAVSRFIGLGYEIHKENGTEKLHEDSPRRVLTSQKRGAANQRLILENGHHNNWEFIGTSDEVRNAQREDPEEDHTTQLKGWKLDIWIALRDVWQSTSEVFDQLPEPRKKKNNAKTVFREGLRALVQKGLIQQQSAGYQCEASWRRKPQELV